MTESTSTPCVPVAMGKQTRLYHPFITTAPASLDAPATMTLHAGTLSELSGFASDPMIVGTTRARTPARIVLIDAVELSWQRARYREHQHRLTATDPLLVGLKTLEHWLWQRLWGTPSNGSSVDAIYAGSGVH